MWFKKLLSVLFYLLVESFLIGFIIMVLLKSFDVELIKNLTYLQMVGAIWGAKLILNNVFATTTYNTTDEELGIEENTTDDKNVINGNNVA